MFLNSLFACKVSLENIILISLFMEQPKYFSFFFFSFCKDLEKKIPKAVGQKDQGPGGCRFYCPSLSSLLCTLGTLLSLSDRHFHTCKMLCLD